jgi:Na+/H+ antiporter NhaD/arsenite permease-like protein
VTITPVVIEACHQAKLPLFPFLMGMKEKIQEGRELNELYCDFDFFYFYFFFVFFNFNFNFFWLTAVATSANIGSAALPVGNPQNMV